MQCPWTFGYHRGTMSDPKLLDSLNERFAIAGVLKFEAGSGGLIRAAVGGRSAEGHVYLHGAHVTHYRPAGQRPLLFLSERSRFATGKAIRGGVPVIFPWFGARAGHSEAPDHGFARTRSCPSGGDGSRLRTREVFYVGLSSRSPLTVDGIAPRSLWRSGRRHA